MHWRLTIALVLLAQTSPAPARGPIVVELFTSEGCSSCPPADELLTKLAKEPTIDGVPVIPLGMHVTYWDQQGWKDPASLQAATDRQQLYGRAVFGVDNVYTPQAVIDGRAQVIGSSEAAIRRAVGDAVKQPHVTVRLTASVDQDGIHATVTTENVPVEHHEQMREWLIVTEDALTSVVTRGENGGRTLHNDAVVRRIVDAEKQQLGKPAPQWNRDHLKLIAIVQGEKTRRIYGAATVPLK